MPLLAHYHVDKSVLRAKLSEYGKRKNDKKIAIKHKHKQQQEEKKVSTRPQRHFPFIVEHVDGRVGSRVAGKHDLMHTTPALVSTLAFFTPLYTCCHFSQRDAVRRRLDVFYQRQFNGTRHTLKYDTAPNYEESLGTIIIIIVHRRRRRQKMLSINIIIHLCHFSFFPFFIIIRARSFSGPAWAARFDSP